MIRAFADWKMANSILYDHTIPMRVECILARPHRIISRIQKTCGPVVSRDSGDTEPEKGEFLVGDTRVLCVS
jgi:hypothetical protein